MKIHKTDFSNDILGLILLGLALITLLVNHFAPKDDSFLGEFGMGCSAGGLLLLRSGGKSDSNI